VCGCFYVSVQKRNKSPKREVEGLKKDEKEKTFKE